MKINVEIDSITKEYKLMINGEEVPTADIKSLTAGWYNYSDEEKDLNETFFNVTSMSSLDGTRNSFGFSFNNKESLDYKDEVYSISDEIGKISKNAKRSRAMARILKQKK